MTYYNELFSTDGQARPHYAGVVHHWKSLPPKERRALHVRSKRLFAGDYAQDPLPRLLTQEEFQFLSRGVEQRARAILAFLRDYCTKGSRWNRVMPADTLHSMIARHHMGNLLRKVNPDQLAFPYGPDIIRDRAGRWRVVEDSAGIIGGIGDLVQGQKILYKLMPGLHEMLPRPNDPEKFFTILAQYFTQKAAQNNGIPLLYLRPYKDESDQETRRLAQIFAKFGIDSTTSSNQLRKIEIREGKEAGIFLKKSGTIQRIGALIFHAGPEQLDNRAIRIQMTKLRDPKNSAYQNEIVRALIRAPSLGTALVNGHAWTNFSPGVQFVNDKIFGLFVDSMIHRFLKETPLLASIPAKSVAIRTQHREWRVDRSILTNLRCNKDRYVIKKVNEDGGSGVWIGKKESMSSLNTIIEKMHYRPKEFIVQEFEHLSVLDNRIVDLRIHAHVDSERIIMSNTPWGRANWINGNGKVNIGSKGFASPVVALPN
ncbi:MAG: hypothetical protein A2X86_18390 [Bdellovibrionales bacterium GWA2_49_15]|nr:MAG: hypothetical protein A2X86_18390 [Bdellovibrionales bacterium GWA2_49_15]HAZ11694.1 hypothetical protein [Bdellovibrionales bacterium]